MCDKCKCAFTPEQKIEVLKLLFTGVDYWIKYQRQEGDRVFPESFQNCLRILFPRGIE